MQSARRQAAAGVVILVVYALVAWMAARAGAVEITLRATDAPADAKIYWSIIDPPGTNLIVRSDGREAAVEVGRASVQIEREMFLIDWDRRTFERRRERWVLSPADVLPGPGPGPGPPGPGPVDPEGFAGEVARAARMLRDDTAAMAFAKNFAAVAAEVGAGSLTKLEDVATRIKQLNEAVPTKVSWREFGASMTARLRQQKSLAEVREVLEQIARGLFAAGGAG